jgi:chromosome segregation ATPase
MESMLKEVEVKETDYLRRIRELKQEKSELSKDVDGLLEEMEQLEVGSEEQRSLKEAMEAEIEGLKEELNRLRERSQPPKKKRKRVESLSKRFHVLYKNISFTERAVEGFLSLTDEFQLKAEALIHRLNEDDSSVTVKRKVFGKGGKMNILELDFSYSGRLYYQKSADSKIKIISIGTKNTQEQDLAYLEGYN